MTFTHFAHSFAFVASFCVIFLLLQAVATSPRGNATVDRRKLVQTADGGEQSEPINANDDASTSSSNGPKSIDIGNNAFSSDTTTLPNNNEVSNDDEEAEQSDCCTMACNVCFDDVTIDQLSFCDHLMANKCGEPNESHAFCIECLKQYTKTAHETVPFARGGLGLKCMVPNCANPISWQEIRALITDQKESIQALENCCAELCVTMCGLNFLERCPECNCAVEMSAPPTDEKCKFFCPECGCTVCRICREKWEEEHDDLPCEQFAKQQHRQGYLMEKSLSEVIVHKCHKCNIRFVKADGCNYIICGNGQCAATHCYCCRMPDINVDHFCSCPPTSDVADDPYNPKCSLCSKCLQTANVDEVEQRQMERIRNETTDG